MYTMRDRFVTTDKTSFIDRFVEVNSKHTDIPPDYLLAGALTCLSLAGHQLRVVSSATGPSGLGLNQYFLLVGPSVISRKTTAMNCAIRVLEASKCLRGRMIGDCTPAGLIDFMDDHQPGPVLYMRDEINDVFRAMGEKSTIFQLNSVLLEMYKRRSYRYQRVKKGAKKSSDTISVEGVSLSVMGGATPAIYADLTSRIVENGMVGRFIVTTDSQRGPIVPPKPLDRAEVAEWSVSEQMLAADLDRIYEATERGPYELTFTAEAYEVLGKLQEDISSRYARDYAEAISCFARIGSEACYRTAALVALSREDANPTKLVVCETDARVAMTWSRRWLRNAIMVARNASSTLNMRCAEKTLEGAVKMCRNGSKVIERTDLVRRMRLTSREVKEAEETLKLMGLIEVKLKDREPGKAGRPCVQWALTELAFNYASAPSVTPKMVLTYEDAPEYPDSEAPGSSVPF